MTPDEIATRLRAGGVRLAFDTNAMYFDKRLIAVCTAITRWNERLAARGQQPVALLVCTVAHAEKLFDLKQRYRDTFNADVILRGLSRKGLLIQPFEHDHALETAMRLGEKYPSEDAWHRAKKERCLRCVGLDPKAVQAAGTGRGCGATVDWLIGAHARAEGCVLVTGDTGVEFSGLTERVGLATLESALRQLVDEPS